MEFLYIPCKEENSDFYFDPEGFLCSRLPVAERLEEKPYSNFKDIRIMDKIKIGKNYRVKIIRPKEKKV